MSEVIKAVLDEVRERRREDAARDAIWAALKVCPELNGDYNAMLGRQSVKWHAEFENAMKDPRWAEAFMLAKLQGGDP